MNTGRRILRQHQAGGRHAAAPATLPMASKIIMRPTASLVPYARNARLHSEQSIQAVIKSIQRFGFIHPVAVDNKSGIWAGHARVMAAERLRIPRTPTIDISYLSPEERRAFAIADNQTALLSSWDEELLTAELADLDLSGFDLDVIGFTDRDLAGLGIDGPGQPGDAPRETVPSSWACVVECRDEADQVALIERLQAEGYKVKGTIG